MIAYVYSAIIGVSLASSLLLWGARPQAAPVPTPDATSAAQPFTPANTREQFAIDLLAALDNAQPAPAMVGMVVEWQIAEDGSDGALARNNPLNTTACGHNQTGAINADGACGVAGYATWQDGIEASRDTLLQANFSAITQALRANDAEGAKQALWASPWAESHYGYGATWPVYQAQPSAQAQAVGQPYLLQGDVGTNVLAALHANGGALLRFRIAPGATWSFGHSIAPLSALGTLPTVCGPAGCYAGGGWCDLSALYVNVADQLGLDSRFPAHGGVSDPRFPGILLDDNGNGGDLFITNVTSAAVTFRAHIDGDLLFIEGGF